MRGKPVIHGTDDHRSIAKAMQDSPVNGNAFTKAMADAGGNYQKAKKILENSPGNMNSPADAMDSPADAMDSPADAMDSPTKVLAPVIRTVGKITKIVPKVTKKAKNVVDDVVEYVPKTTRTVKDKIKTVLGYGATGAAGAGAGAAINEKASDAKKKIEEEVSGGNKGGSKGGSKSSSSGAYSKASKNDPNLGDYVKKRKSLKKGSAEYGANQFKINKAYYGEESAKKIQDRYNKKHGISTSTETKGRKTTTVTSKEGGPTTTRTTKVRKDGTRKKLVVDKKNVKTTDVIDGKKVTGVSDKKTKFKYDKEGTKRKSKVTYKTDVDADQKTDVKGRVKRKYDASGKLVKTKAVTKAGGRRYVTKTDAEGKETTKSRRTIKGILTGKGKKKKEES